MKGEVMELLPGANFLVTLENGQKILAHLSGRMRINRILLIVGDKIRVEVSPYDLSKGRIVYRY
ncbi:translation initiation factor IF-1 [Candidatus Kuenenbacteria bacterium CG_4_9_14_3_um_filter_39_14]|uniref:Translation initiation factor IF-1 n=7 Tax=Candidatus Kueneniibacteriota TaxID=1752740 RepID=A0A2M7IMV1_9BACT|nr:translation initiation factor IF-1 [Candidatus Kuenenbacteria bacterium]OIP56404.1 MAG: translation initiation factor IF-1 [Candidatus Kuenenbacteria bacterium CG2_30_39_24]PIP28731.1 MAG: translation initiation factor IF-1 [Candidatus Kuenenbacteria bacterium CG23_combo_of_CG06-09_8_20_14_all_39_39]PIP75190.1 MAG: translation initiation factor IF-1 [Candidatus Kuenenbacteria bacterium CG22_combo_CG10-13_8_21_14_all_39_9]PIR80542.1 MAG: translation initiation factor IF-1 [Candidatus Kuenenba